MPLYAKRHSYLDSSYQQHYPALRVRVPSGIRRVLLYALITGHGNEGAVGEQCAEFCATQHVFTVNRRHRLVHALDGAGESHGCADLVHQGVVPNQHGTWLYGRGGWCPGLDVRPFLHDISALMKLDGDAENVLEYNGLRPNGAAAPNELPPGTHQAYIDMAAYLVFYR